MAISETMITNKNTDSDHNKKAHRMTDCTHINQSWRKTSRQNTGTHN